jgi:hypothetical protein
LRSSQVLNFSGPSRNKAVNPLIGSQFHGSNMYENGKGSERPIGIITPWDSVEIDALD